MVAANNLRQIAIALANYADSNGGRLPPAVLRDREGRALHSWRVLILPYLEQGDLYREFRLDEPWDSPHNKALLPRMPREYASPRDLPGEARADPYSTFCQVFTGPGTAFEGPRGLRYPHDFPNGTAQTILVVEAAEPVPWTQPADLVYDPHGPLPPLGGVFTGEGRFSLFGSSREKGFHAGMADGSVRFIQASVNDRLLGQLIRRNDEVPPQGDW